MKALCHEAGKTVRAAIGGWPETWRLLTIMAAATAMLVIYCKLAH